MMSKSYRGHASADAGSPFGAAVAALCVGLALAAPWLALAYGIASAWRWVVG